MARFSPTRPRIYPLLNPVGTNGLVGRFTKKLESLRGHAHVAPGPEVAAQIVRDICAESAAKCIALGLLENDFREAITTSCEAVGIEVLAPPYPFTELPGTIDRAHVGVGYAEFAIAETGTLVEVALDDSIRLVSALPRTYIGIVRASNFVDRLQDSAPRLRAIFKDNPKNCTVSFISGPSRTGDIELILTLGVHGPEQAHAIIIDDIGGG